MNPPTHQFKVILPVPNLISRSPLHRAFPVAVLALAFALFALLQTLKAQDGDELNGNTAEGAGALHTYISTASSAQENTAVGFQALYSDNTGIGNTATGWAALNSNTTGNANTATGSGALESNQTGSSNTAIGSDALLGNKTGGQNTAMGSGTLANNNADNNTAIGADALFSNTNGSDNTAMGYQALFKNGFDGMDNTAVGSGALSSNVSASFNTAIGFNALLKNTAGSNTAVGDQALLNNTGGRENTATGAGALFKNKSGNNNTADGLEALFSNTTGSNNTADGLLALENNSSGHDNTAQGFQALAGNSGGSSNVGIGSNAGASLTSGSNNIDIGANVTGPAAEANTIRIGKQGTQKSAIIAGIYGTPLPGGVAVVVGSGGKLGVATSSVRFKEAIKPMDKASEAILALKPVTFRYKRELDSNAIPQFGLVAEEVAKVSPDLVVRDDDGQIYTVRYDAVNAMLLNEFLKEHQKVEELTAIVTKQQAINAEQQKQIETLAAGLQKVTTRVELGEAALRVVSEH